VVDAEFRELQATLQCTTNIPATSYWVHGLESDGAYDVVLKQLPDRGNISSGEGATEIIEDFRPHFLLLVGIGGGVHGRDDTGIGDVIVVDYVEYYEFRKLAGGRTLQRKFPFDHPSRLMRSDIAKPLIDRGEWQQALTVGRPEPGVCKGIVGNLITGDKLLADPTNATQRAVLEESDKAIVVDMESCGVARAVYKARGSIHYNIQYAIIRGVSDLVDAENNDAMRQQWRPYAAHVAATFAAKMTEVLLTLEQSS
jgi:nucleoside phosphorylase